MSEDPAASRFFIMGLVRLAGLFLALFGIVILAGNSRFPIWLGYALALAGILAFFYIPKLLARKWRSPPE